MKSFGFFDRVFGTDDEPAPLAKFDAIAVEEANDAHPLEEFFADALVAAAVGGDDAFSKFKTAVEDSSKRFSDRYKKLAAKEADHTIRPIASLPSGETRDAALAKASTARKVRRTFISGNTVVEEFDAKGSLVRTFIEEPK
jgi:hypothetical protein